MQFYKKRKILSDDFSFSFQRNSKDDKMINVTDMSLYKNSEWTAEIGN